MLSDKIFHHEWLSVFIGLIAFVFQGQIWEKVLFRKHPKEAKQNQFLAITLWRSCSQNLTSSIPLFSNPSFFSFSFELFFQWANTHWHVSRVVYKWWHLADCKLSQFIKQQKIHFVNKRACVTNFLAEKQQMALVVCHSV